MTKILTGDIGQLMGFIEDHYISFGNQFAKAALFHHQIGKKEMVVHDNHIGVHSTFTRPDHKTLFIARAVSAEAVIVSAGDQRPDRAVFGHARTAADVAIFRLR